MPVTPPSHWLEQLRTLPIDELNLSYNPRRLALPAGRSLRDVENDLTAGFWLARRNTARSGEFRLGGTEFELRIRRRRWLPGDDETPVDICPWIAEVLNVDESTSVPRQGRIQPSRVMFKEVWYGAPCDLAEIEGKLRERERRLRDGSRRGVTQVEVRTHGELQRSVLREYGELEVAIQLV